MPTSNNDLSAERHTTATSPRHGMELASLTDGGDEAVKGSSLAAVEAAVNTGGESAEGMAVEDSSETIEAPKVRICGICNEKPGIYKCARCSLPFCSVVCSKTHRENHPADPDPPPKPMAIPESSVKPTEGPETSHDSRHPFQVLDDSHQLKLLFQRYPGLQRQLLAISAATEPPGDTASGRSLRENFLSKASGSGRPRKEQWNHDVGIRNGKEALRKARKAHGEDGEGVREYSELIVHLTSRKNGDSDAAALLRNKVAQEDAKLIQSLLDEEGRRFQGA